MRTGSGGIDGNFARRFFRTTVNGGVVGDVLVDVVGDDSAEVDIRSADGDGGRIIAVYLNRWRLRVAASGRNRAGRRASGRGCSRRCRCRSADDKVVE